ncbi:radical SAM protein [Spirosoma sp.]|uniref:B12-binding domain-containing radical SAM protein n=1 Tax=Spirosoma sp. TaxID=1899569 RepID=UPI00263027D9|nr:radical SAM protein [Spirosoma sp.]MCX6217967.1 radical SAM protein [Spirosoma sp.]
MSLLRILLIWPKARTDPDWGGDLGAIAEPLALEYLAAGLLEDGHDVRILDLRLHPETLAATVSEYKPHIVGVTAYSMHVRAGLLVLKTVKEIIPDCLTVVGGHHATILPEDFFEPVVDLVVSGEGVSPVRAIAKQCLGEQNYYRIPGVWCRHADGAFQYGGEQPPFLIDSLPRPNRTLTQADRHRYFIDWMQPVALVRTTVGCPYRCTFCSLWQVMDGRYHKRAIEQVVAEISEIKEEYVFLIDDEAFIDSKRMELLALALKAAGVHKRFFAYCRIDSLIRNKDVLQHWKNIGLERLFVGIDAYTDKDLKEYNKRQSLQQIEKGLDTARELDIEVLAQFVVNTDYSASDFKQLVRFVEHFKLDYPTFTILTPLPGTDLLAPDFSNITIKQPNGRPDWDYFDTQSLVMPSRLPPDQFRQIYRNLFKLFAGSYSQFLIHKPIVRHHTNRITAI